MRGVRSPLLERAFGYWRNVDAEVGRRIEDKVRSGAATKRRRDGRTLSVLSRAA